MSTSARRFNEAPIHESGKCEPLPPETVIAHLASMRPRFMNRGSVAVSVKLGVGGFRFNEAPIHESGKCGRGRVSLSRPKCFNEAPIHESGKFSISKKCHPCVLRFNEAPIHESGKSARRPQSGGAGTPASMRPRFMNRGSWQLPNPVHNRGLQASMRPRFMNRGSARTESASATLG